MTYGYHAGFGITRRSNNTFDGFRYRSTFICSKGGQSRLRSGVTRPARKRNMKIGCKAKMIVKDAHFQRLCSAAIISRLISRLISHGIIFFSPNKSAQIAGK